MAKRFRPDSGSDTSNLDESLSYLDLDTGNILEKATSPNSSSKGVILPAKTYDALMKKLNHIDTSLSKLDKLDKLDDLEKADMPGGGARGQNLVHLQKVGFLC